MAAVSERQSLSTKSSKGATQKLSKKENEGGMMHQLVAAGFEELSKRFPAYSQQLKSTEPYVHQAIDLMDSVYPIVAKLFKQVASLWKMAEQRGLDEYGPIIVGLILCFFGGTYVTLIASYEAMRLSVWNRLVSSVTVLRDNYLRAKEASEKDDKLDDNNDGIADVKQVTNQQLLSRKLMVFMKASDPNQVSAALSAIWSGFLVIIATVKMQFAQSITLGASLGEMFDERFGQPMASMVTNALPVEMKKWGPTLCTWAVRFFAGLIALFVHRIIVAIHAAIRGAAMFTNASFKLAHERGWLPSDIGTDSRQATIVSGVITFLGFYWQLTHAFGLPFPLNILFLPLTIAEWFLTFMVNIL